MKIFVVAKNFILLGLTITMLEASNTNEQVCQEPSNIEIAANEYMETISTHSFSLNPAWSGRNRTDSNICETPNVYIDVQYKHFSGHFRCTSMSNENGVRKHRVQKKKANTNEKSICPWKYIKNIDKNRKPEVLLEARCACAKPTNGLAEVECKNVHQYVGVFRRTGCSNGVYSYARMWERVAIACVAVESLTQSADPVEEKQKLMAEK